MNTIYYNYTWIFNIFWHHFKVSYSTDHRKLLLICFLLTITWKKLVQAELALFSVEKTHVTSDVIFIVCTLIDNSCEPISVQEFWQLMLKILYAKRTLKFVYLQTKTYLYSASDSWLCSRQIVKLQQNNKLYSKVSSLSLQIFWKILQGQHKNLAQSLHGLQGLLQDWRVFKEEEKPTFLRILLKIL